MTMLNIENTDTWSRVPGKIDVYRQDAGFLCAAAALQATDGTNAAHGLQTTTYALIKPDAFAFGKAEPALDYLLAHSFTVTSYHVLQLTEAQMLGLWRYQWNRATPARMTASLSIGLLGPSILVVLNGSHAAGDAPPAAPRLWSLKGSASAAGRSPDRLRSVLDVSGRYFGYVHVPDEPADVVRELAWLLGTPAMVNVIAGNRPGEYCEPALRTRMLAMQTRFGLPWTPHAVPPNSLAGERDAAASVVMNGYTELCSPEFAHAGCEARDEAWRRVAACAPLLQDNREGVRAIVESGDVTDPATLWRTMPRCTSVAG
ncbi:hypothetical protein [Cupriavidus sp. Marseille-Q8015]